jgi:hypothetical protein
MHRIEIEVVGHNARGPIYRIVYAGEVLIDRDPGAGVRRRVGTYAHGHHRQAGGLAIGRAFPAMTMDIEIFVRCLKGHGMSAAPTCQCAVPAAAL